DDYDSPALLVYPARVKANILAAMDIVDNPAVLRPHAKTSKMSEVATLLIQQGVTKFKCATIAEAEMLAMAGAKDVLLAYQPVGPKVLRLLQLVKAYPSTRFACLVDNIENATRLNKTVSAQHSTLDVYIDLNIGMGRTGITPDRAFVLFVALRELPALRFTGLHAYDGHIHETDLEKRIRQSDEGFAPVAELAAKIEAVTHQTPVIIAGGTPTFPAHARRGGVECSPGTFVFCDWNYKHQLPDEPFDYAALVLTRVVSIIDQHTLCLDLGHKSVAAENPLPRVWFLNMPAAQPIAQSEEHLVVKLSDTASVSIGDVWYGIPAHICPTVALYEKAWTVEDGRISGDWKVVARNRYINF
ncbi:MAG: D-TA family PLP-dependent enzyme, partial [Bacteroidetes bacterium]|nr:D-TA family PLP-dependent enzyme [Bacteroidota bacterium]